MPGRRRLRKELDQGTRNNLAQKAGEFEGHFKPYAEHLSKQSDDHYQLQRVMQVLASFGRIMRSKRGG